MFGRTFGSRFGPYVRGKRTFLASLPLGVKAGLAAGMKVVMVSPRPPPPPEEELRPHQFLPSLFYFSPEHWGFPAFE